jgi:hypothetical protein
MPVTTASQDLRTPNVELRDSFPNLWLVKARWDATYVRLLRYSTTLHGSVAPAYLRASVCGHAKGR